MRNVSEILKNTKTYIITTLVSFSAGALIVFAWKTSNPEIQYERDESYTNQRIQETTTKLQQEFQQTLVQQLAEQQRKFELNQKIVIVKKDTVQPDGTKTHDETITIDTHKKDDTSSTVNNTTNTTNSTTNSTTDTKITDKTDINTHTSIVINKKPQWSLGVSTSMKVSEFPSSFTSNIENVSLRVGRRIIGNIWFEVGAMNDFVKTRKWPDSKTTFEIGIRFEF